MFYRERERERWSVASMVGEVCWCARWVTNQNRLWCIRTPPPMPHISLWWRRPSPTSQTAAKTWPDSHTLEKELALAILPWIKYSVMWHTVYGLKRPGNLAIFRIEYLLAIYWILYKMYCICSTFFFIYSKYYATINILQLLMVPVHSSH